MICINSNCNKKFKEPLKLYNGKIACPYCKEIINNIGQVKITVNNENLFNFSEMCYYRYLTPKSYNFVASRTLNTKAELLNNAIKYCEQAAREGNPFAIYKVGYYYEFHADSQDDKIKMAYEYYKTIFELNRGVEVEEGANGITNAELNVIKDNSAKGIARLISKYKYVFANNNRYNVSQILAEIKAFNKNIISTDINALSKTKYVKNVFETCVQNKTRSPLFGVLFLTSAELKEVFGELGSFTRFIHKGVTIKLLETNNRGEVDFANKRFIEQNANTLVNFTDKNVKYYYLFFYNELGKHKLLSKTTIKKIKHALENNDEFNECNNLIVYPKAEYVIHDDDIVYLRNGLVPINYTDFENYITRGV